MPSERVLAELLDLDRGTLRRGIKLLETDRRLVREGRRLAVLSTVDADQGASAWLSRAIVVVVPAIPTSDPMRAAWLRYSTLGATEAVREAGLHAITLNAGELADAQLAPLVASRPMGVLIPEITDDSFVARAASSFARDGIPVVVFGNDESLASYDRVISDHDVGSYLLTSELLQRGRRPARFWRRPWDRWWSEDRSAGYLRAMSEAGHRPFPILEFAPIQTTASDREGFEQTSRQLVGFLLEALRGPDRMDALMVTSDRDAFYAAAAVRVIGLEPGRDVVIAGYDDYSDLCAESKFIQLSPRLTINKRNERMGREMLDLLLERVAGKCPAVAVMRTVAPDLVCDD